MSGIRFAMLIILPFLFGALYTGIYLFYFGEDQYLIPFIVLIAIGLAIFFAKEEINYWYDKKFPPKLDPPIISWLTNFFPFYNSLEGLRKEKFEQRLALYLNARSFKLMLKERKDIPEDFKAIIASHAIQMTMGLEDFLVGDYDHIICYNHPFPTPANQFLHTVEVHHEDGIILLSFEQLVASVGKPKEVFNIAYYAYAQALLKLYPDLEQFEAENIEELLPFNLQHVIDLTGFETPDQKAIQLSCFFMDNITFLALRPQQHQAYNKVLNYVY